MYRRSPASAQGFAISQGADSTHTIHIPYEEEDYGICGDGQALWPLFCTPKSKPELARKVKRLDLALANTGHDFEVPVVDSLPGTAQFSSTMTIHMQEARIAGVILQHATEIESLSLQLSEDGGDDRCVRCAKYFLMQACLKKLFPGFDPATAHLQDLAILQKLNTIFFHGYEFHWILAKSPHLREIELYEIGHILPDGASQEKNHSVQKFGMTCRSGILNPDITRYNDLAAFLDHFQELVDFSAQIVDTRSGYQLDEDADVDQTQQGSFELFVGMLLPLAPNLTSLTFSVKCTAQERELAYLRQVLPAMVSSTSHHSSISMCPTHVCSDRLITRGLTSPH